MDGERIIGRDREIAYALLRVTVGVMFFFFGVGKFLQGLDRFASGMVQRFANSPLPSVLVEPFGYTLPFLEVGIGALLILGLFTRIALILSGLLMLALTFGVVMEPSPPTVANNATYALVIFVLLWCADHNRYSADTWRDRHGGGRESAP